MEIIDVTKSLKLQNYLSVQNLTEAEISELDKVDLSNLVLKSEFERIQKSVERYQTLKSQVEKGEGDIVLASDEMRRLANDVLVDTGKDISNIDLNQLDSVTKIENLLEKSGIRSKNDMVVRFSDDDYFNRNDYVRVVLADSNSWGRYGIQTGARMAITRSGKILTVRSALYEK